MKKFKKIGNKIKFPSKGGKQQDAGVALSVSATSASITSNIARAEYPRIIIRVETHLVNFRCRSAAMSTYPERPQMDLDLADVILELEVDDAVAVPARLGGAVRLERPELDAADEWAEAVAGQLQ